MRRVSVESCILQISQEASAQLHHNVYVVELSKEVLSEKKFQVRNPNYVKGKPCYYVGMTGLTPEERYAKHKAGIKSNKYVTQYGIHLRPDLYEKYNPMTYDNACEKEVELANTLRELGNGVWQA